MILNNTYKITAITITITIIIIVIIIIMIITTTYGRMALQGVQPTATDAQQHARGHAQSPY